MPFVGLLDSFVMAFCIVGCGVIAPKRKRGPTFYKFLLFGLALALHVAFRSKLKASHV